MGLEQKREPITSSHAQWVKETLTLVSCDSEREAHYIAVLVNSVPFQFAASSYSQAGGKSMGSVHVLDHIRIPKYDPADPVHRALAEASKEAHEAVAQGDEARLREIEEHIDTVAAKLWGLNAKELAEIRRSLAMLETRG